MNKNDHGFALLGLLIAVAIMALLAYGIYFFLPGKKDKQTIKKSAEDQFIEIKKNIDEQNKIIEQSLKDEEEESE